MRGLRGIRFLIVLFLVVGMFFSLSDLATHAAAAPNVRVEITNTSDSAGTRKPVSAIEFALRNSYKVNGTDLVLTGLRDTGAAYRVVLNGDGTLRLEDRANQKVLLEKAAVIRLVPQDTSKSDNLVDVKRYHQGTLYAANPYRNIMEFQVATRAGEASVIMINELDMERYLWGVVPREMSNSWPVEALKAQAVAARTYALTHTSNLRDTQGYINDTTSFQVYGGLQVEGERANAAVNATAGKVLTHNGRPITAWFSSSNGGYTELAENVWLNPVPYLSSVPDPYDLGAANPNREWSAFMSQEELQRQLQSKGYSVGEVQNLTPTKVAPSGRIMEMEVRGQNGTKVVLFKENNRTVFGLKSSLYNVERSQDSGQVSVLSAAGRQTVSMSGKYVLAAGQTTPVAKSSGNRNFAVGGSGNTAEVGLAVQGFTFTGKGWGHGVGMSQYGAYHRANDGQNYQEILRFYFPGTTLSDNYNQ